MNETDIILGHAREETKEGDHGQRSVNKTHVKVMKKIYNLYYLFPSVYFLIKASIFPNEHWLQIVYFFATKNKIPF